MKNSFASYNMPHIHSFWVTPPGCVLADGGLDTTNSRRGIALGDDGACAASVEPVSNRPQFAAEASCQGCREKTMWRDRPIPRTATKNAFISTNTYLYRMKDAW